MAVTGIALGVQENCEPDCVTDAEYATAKWVFWIAFGVWAASLLVHYWRRQDIVPLGFVVFGVTAIVVFGLSAPALGGWAAAAVALLGAVAATSAVVTWARPRVDPFSR
jgi:hypothetical protein